MGRGNFSGGRGRGGGGRGRGRGAGRGGGRGRDGPRPGALANFRGPGYDDGVPKSVDEKVVGISRFLTPEVPGFRGTVKERFSDFIVREVALDGQVVRLTQVKQSVDKAAAKKEQKISEIVKKRVLGFLEDASQPADTAEGGFPVNNRVRGLVGKLAGRLLGLFNQTKRSAAAATDRVSIGQLKAVVAEVCDAETAENLGLFLTRIVDSRVNQQASGGTSATGTECDGSNSQEFFLPVITEKEHRMRIHKCLRELGANLVVSDTVQNNTNESVIRVRPMIVDGRKRKDIDQRANREQWPVDRPDYLQFVLYKKNMETLAVVSQLARAMGMNQSAFSYAGTKDKRGITTQLITVYRGNEEKLVSLNRARKQLEDFNFLVGNPEYVRDRLNLGDLKGNRFSMAIRSLPSDDVVADEDLHRAVESWKQRGFINYFGLQRFGTRAVATHEVGRAVLRRDYKVAVDLLMQPQEGDATKIAEARKLFVDTQDVDTAIRSFPPYFIAEHSILQGFRAHGMAAYAQAFACIPRHLRMMYTHSYQSYVWNTIASIRLDQFPSDRPVLGDLVLRGESDHDELIDEDLPVSIGLGDNNEEPSLPKKRRMGVQARNDVVIIDDSNINDYSIFDVVLPLPGYDIQLPRNLLKDRYEALLEKDGVDFISLTRAASSEYHLPGSYRHLLRKPIDVVHEIKRYDDPTVQLLETDVDRLQNKNPSASIPNGKSRALCLEFQLSSSSYATMAVRELMKQSSNLHVQLQLKGQQT